jgi:CRISPR type III-B/RAMP module-associated protein Cmr5
MNKGVIMNNEKNQIDFSGHIVNLEDAQNVELPVDKKTFSDGELENAGLVKTSAFIRSKRSKNALRIEKHKEKKADNGIKQLNIEVPDQYRNAIKNIAKTLSENRELTEKDLAVFSFDRTKQNTRDNTKQLTDATSQNVTESTKSILDIESIELTEKVLRIVTEGGFKAFLLKLLV